jgi:hypothetical protein
MCFEAALKCLHDTLNRSHNDEPTKDASRDSFALQKHRESGRHEQPEKRMLLTFRPSPFASDTTIQA